MRVADRHKPSMEIVVAKITEEERKAAAPRAENMARSNTLLLCLSYKEGTQKHDFPTVGVAYRGRSRRQLLPSGS